MQTSESRINTTFDPNYYQENKLGIDMVKTHINTIDLQPIIVASANKKIIHLQIIHSLNKMYEMQ